MRKLLIWLMIVSMLSLLVSCSTLLKTTPDEKTTEEDTMDNVEKEKEPSTFPQKDEQEKDAEEKNAGKKDSEEGKTQDYKWKTNLWFSDSQGMSLVKEEHELNFDKEPDAIMKAQAIMEKLIKGESTGGNITTIPATTKVLYIELDGSTIVLDLSAEFETDNVGGSTGILMALSPIVYSLTEIENVDSVFIKIDGKIVEDFKGHMSLDRKLSREDFSF